MITEDDLTRLLNDAAGAFPEPEMPTLEVPPARPVWRRRGVQLLMAAAALVVAGLVVSTVDLPGTNRSQLTSAEGQGGGVNSGAPRGLAGTGGGASNDTGNSYTGGDAGGGGTTGTPGGGVLSSQPTVTSGARAAVPSASLGQQAAPPVAPQTTTVPAAAAPDTRDGARIVKTGKVSLVVDDGKVSATVSRVTAVAAAQRGYVSDSSTQEYGDTPSATVTLRVPVGGFETVVQGIRGLGAEVASSEVSGRDVTAEYADTQAQITSLKAARERFLAILAGAKTIGETLTVQQRVDDVQARIDRLEGQRRVLASQSDLATLTVAVGEKDDEKLVESAPSGFGKAWDDAKDGFTGGVQGLIARSGRALLVGIVALVALFVLRLGWRLARRRLV